MQRVQATPAAVTCAGPKGCKGSHTNNHPSLPIQAIASTLSALRPTLRITQSRNQSTSCVAVAYMRHHNTQSRNRSPLLQSSKSKALSKPILLSLLSFCTSLKTPACMTLPCHIHRDPKVNATYAYALLNVDTAPYQCHAPQQAFPRSWQV
jgi:hypothetical protein